MKSLLKQLKYLTSSPNKDPYKILGIQRGASDEEIKVSYYTLAKKYHPDIKP